MPKKIDPLDARILEFTADDALKILEGLRREVNDRLDELGERLKDLAFGPRSGGLVSPSIKTELERLASGTDAKPGARDDLLP